MDLAQPALDAPLPVPVATGIEAPRPASRPELDQAVAALGDHARAFARTPPRDKAALLRSILPRLRDAAPELGAALCQARGLDPSSPAAAEAWLAGVAPVTAYVRLLAEALEDIASNGRPSLPAETLHTRRDGRLAAGLEPRTWAEHAADAGRTTTVLFAEGRQPEDVIAAQAPFYRRSEPEGGVTLVLGAGDPAAGLMDALFALFVEGRVTVLAPGTLAAAAGPLAERALSPLVERGFLRVAHGGDDVAAHLAAHPGVTAVLRAAPTDEGPLLVVPCLYSTAELAHLTRSVAAQLAFDGATSRVLALPTGWAQRARFLKLLDAALAAASPRRAHLAPWTVAALPAADPQPSVAPGARVLSIAAIGSDDPLDFLAAAVDLCNDRLGAPSTVQIAVHPIHEEDPEIGAALERAVGRLRCGAVGINRWPALLGWAAAPPWGGHPAQGSAFRHNARMLEGVDKVILHGPLLGPLRPAWFADTDRARRTGVRLAAFQAAPSLRGAWGVAVR